MANEKLRGNNTGFAPEQPPQKPLGGDADLAQQKEKIVAGRYSPKSHLERSGMKERKKS